MRPSHSDWLDDDDVESEDKPGDLDQEQEDAFADVPTEEAEEVPDLASSFASGGSLRPSLQEAKARTPPSEFKLSLPTNQDSLSSQLIRSSSETCLPKLTLVHHKLN